MRLDRIMLMQLSSMSYYAVVDFVVQCRGRRRINHVPAKRDMIDCNNFASWIIADMYSIMLMTLQELCNSCRTSCYFIIFYCNRASGLSRAVYSTDWATTMSTVTVHRRSCCYVLLRCCLAIETLFGNAIAIDSQSSNGNTSFIACTFSK